MQGRDFLCCSVCFFVLMKLGDGTGTGSKNQGGGLSFGNLINDTETLKKDLSGVVNIAFENLSLKNMKFYFFQLHDQNRDQHLDGNELYSALCESSIKLSEDLSNSSETEEYFVNATDSFLLQADIDDDGLISWEEYSEKIENFLKL